MSEDNNETMQQILNLQIQIAAGMKLSDEVVDFLRSIPDWGKREWYYICALDRMPLQKLVEMNKKNYTIPKIRKERQDYLVSVYSDLDDVNQKVEKLKKEAQEVFVESRELKDAIMANLETALNKQSAAQEETIRTKDSMIELLKARVAQLEAELKEKGNVPNFGTDKVLERIPNETAHAQHERTAPDKKSEQSLENGIFAEGRRVWLKKKRQTEVKRFIDSYIKNENLSDEQKDFLLTCLEEGMPTSEVAEFASPNLSLEVMKRLKKFKVDKRKEE